MGSSKTKLKDYAVTPKQWIIFASCCVFVFFVYIFSLFNNNITYDSVYEYFLIKHSFAEMWQLIPEDYSPPFYSVSLKLFAEVFGYSLPVNQDISASVSGSPPSLSGRAPKTSSEEDPVCSLRNSMISLMEWFSPVPTGSRL